MTGKDCVAIGSDLRFGIQFQTMACDYQKVYQINDQVFVGLSGLGASPSARQLYLGKQDPE